jgi:hypothetical protein
MWAHENNVSPLFVSDVVHQQKMTHVHVRLYWGVIKANGLGLHGRWAEHFTNMAPVTGRTFIPDKGFDPPP